MSSPGQHPTPAERDERVTMPVDPEAALRALLQVKPERDDGSRDELPKDPD
jgi:hypothetical protein